VDHRPGRVAQGESPGQSAAPWIEALRGRLDARRASGLFRAPRSAPAGLIDLAGNDYLCLRRNERLIEASRAAAAEYGVGAGASRLVGGATELHERFEARFAAFKGADAARILPTGYAANLAALTALPAPGDLILQDKLNHASLIDAGLLASARRSARPVSMRTFPHRDAARAHALGARHIRRDPDSVVWLTTDSVFSMDGDLADLRALAEVRESLNQLAGARGGAGGACLIVDEAHATGVLGARGAGLDEVAGRVADITVSTASKALGSLGGMVAGPREAIEAVDNFARAFIYSTAPPPAQVACVDAALDILRDEPERRARLLDLIIELRAALRERGWPVADAADNPTPIIPLITGAAESAVALSSRLRERGLHAPAIRPPTVPRGAARVRLSLHAGLTSGEIDRLLTAVEGSQAGRPA